MLNDQYLTKVVLNFKNHPGACVVKCDLSSLVKYFYWPFKSGCSFVDHLCYLCFVLVMLSRQFSAALWSPAWKGLTSWLSFVMFNCVFVSFACGVMDQVWFLIVSISDPCCLSYLYYMVQLIRSISKMYGGKRCIWNNVQYKTNIAIMRG